jgi:hypothetical protein
MEGSPFAINDDPLWASTLSAPFSGLHPFPSAALSNSGSPKEDLIESRSVELNRVVFEFFVEEIS